MVAFVVDPVWLVTNTVMSFTGMQAIFVETLWWY